MHTQPEMQLVSTNRHVLPFCVLRSMFDQLVSKAIFRLSARVHASPNESFLISIGSVQDFGLGPDTLVDRVPVSRGYE